MHIKDYPSFQARFLTRLCASKHGSNHVLLNQCQLVECLAHHPTPGADSLPCPRVELYAGYARITTRATSVVSLASLGHVGAAATLAQPPWHLLSAVRALRANSFVKTLETERRKETTQSACVCALRIRTVFATFCACHFVSFSGYVKLSKSCLDLSSQVKSCLV